MIKHEKHTFKNGLRIYLAPMHETQAVTVLFLYGVGSRFEDGQENGLSHFLEHLFFKGTSKRPTTLDISQELDTLGADYNAYTGEDRTGYYVSTAAENFHIAFDVLTDMLYNSKFASEEIEREKGVICEEIKMYHDNPTSYLDEVSKKLVFGQTPLGRDIAGTSETVRSFKREDFVKYRERHYGPENTIVVVAGNPKNHQWLPMITSALAHLPRQKPVTFQPQEPIWRGNPVKIGKRSIDQVHLSLTHYGLPVADRRIETFAVLSNILGGTMSSRLFIEVRERRGLAYYVRSGHGSYADIGLFECSAGVDPQKLDEALRVIIEQIEKLKTEPVTDVELERAKQNLKGRLSLRLEDSHSIARFLANDELELGKIIQPEEYVSLVEKVTQSDIMELANECLTAKGRKLALVGPLKKSDEKRLAALIR